MKEKDDYDEFNVTFEKFQESIKELKFEVKEMVLKGHSDQEIKEVIDNGALALTTMSFKITDVNLQSGFGLHLIESTLRQCNDIAFGYLKEKLVRKNNQ